MTKLTRAVLCTVLALGAVACATEEDEWDTDVLSHGYDSVELQVLRRGRSVYGRYCVGCHGEQGDGQGPAARFLSPKPRDFRVGMIKFALVPSGAVPRDEDLLDVITHGLDGTAMPSWKLLPLEDRRAVIAYLKTFSDKYTKRQPGQPVKLGKDPWRGNADAAIAEGERVYHGIAGCFVCHAAYAPRAKMYEYLTSYDIKVEGFRDHLYEAIPKESQWGEPITPPDFLFDRIKTGFHKQRALRSITAGVGGTAMPTWEGGLKPRQLWAMAYYVESLALMRGTPAATELRDQLVDQPPFELPAPPPPPATEGEPAAPVNEGTEN